MGRPPCCDRSNVKRGPWTAEEDAKILAYVASHGIGNWTLVPKKAGLNRCGKSCRLRWTNYLRPDLKHDNFTLQEEELIINYHKAIGSRWSLIAKYLPGRTDNDVKNYWNTKLKKKLTKMGIDPVTHKPFSQILSDFGNIGRISNSRNQIGPFIRNFNANLIPESEPSSVTIGPSDSNVTLLKPAIEQVQDNSNMDSSMWGFHSRPQVTIVPPQPFFFNEVTSSCCSSPSSSASVTQLSSPQSYPCQHLQPQAQPTHSSSSKWSDFLITDPVLFLEPDFHRVLSSTKLPTFAQNDLSPINVGDRKDLLYFGERLGQEDLGSSTLGAACGNQSNYNHADASSSVASSFVDGILDKDREMRSQFPLLLDPSFEFQDF